MLPEIAQLLCHRILYHKESRCLIRTEGRRLQKRCGNIDLCDDFPIFQRLHEHLLDGRQTDDIQSIIEICPIKQLMSFLESLHNDPALEDT